MEKHQGEEIANGGCRQIAIIWSRKWEIHFYGFQITHILNALICEVIYKTMFEK